MADVLEKLTKLPDQILPFVETAPPWLKVWIYVWIVLTFLTFATVMVSYLVSKQRVAHEQSLERFTVEQPRDGEEIPLGENRSWAAGGRFPLVAYDMEHPPITIDVYKLPELAPVQHGEVRPDNVLGVWRFEPLKFPNDGAFEIVIGATLGGMRTDHRLEVKCRTKEVAYRNSIEKTRAARDAIQLTPRTRESVSLPDLKNQLYELQYRLYGQYFEKPEPLTPQDLSASLETVLEALNLLDPVLPLFPDDFQLQNFRAYFLKDYAQIVRDQGRTADANRALDESSKMFEAIHQQDPHDPAAWNGLGSVAATRGDYQAALLYINAALEIKPDYAEAAYDKAEIQRVLREQAAAVKQPVQKPSR